MLSDDELTQQVRNLARLTEGIYGAALVTNDGFVLKNALPPTIDLDRIWPLALPHLRGKGVQVPMLDEILLIEPGPDAALLVLIQPSANVALIRGAMQQMSRSLIEPIAAMLAM